jgi:two-component system chemotaxis sensor kinase CheA
MVVQYRNRILPLVVLRTLLDCETARDASLDDPVPVIVFDDGKRQLGVVVDQIVDIAEQAITIRQESRKSWFLGSAVIGSRVTEFLDVEQLLQSPMAGWFQASSASSGRKTVLLGDQSAFARGLLRGSLEMSGYTVLEASNSNEMLRALEQRRTDAVLVSPDLPPQGAHSVMESMRRRPEWAAIPVFEVRAGSGHPGSPADSRLDEHAGGSNPGEILSFLSGLSGATEPESTACVDGTRTNR